MSDESHDHPSGQPIGSSFVPIAESLSNIPLEVAQPIEPIPLPQPIPFPGKFCFINLREGCYRISFKPNAGFYVYHGTMRVDRAGGKLAISGDLYKFLSIIVWPGPLVNTTMAARVDPTLMQPAPSDASPALDIPIYARSQYYSYLKVTSVKTSPIFGTGPCELQLTIGEFAYNTPPAGSFNGSFPALPTRTVSVVLSPQAPPAGFTSSYFAGKLFVGGADKGAFTMGWVSPLFRRAKLQVSYVPNAVTPPSSVGAENFQTVFATAGWGLTVSFDAAPLPIPAGTTTLVPGVCPSSADLHALMMTTHLPGPHLDQEWRIHLLTVPGKITCGRGVMFDQIGAHREGVASFCDDGYPTSDSSNFGTAANKKQRDIPRAFLRSASHEVGHGFNQIHQEQEGGADNSIMTTTPSVADVLGGPATGAPGVFPDNINLSFNGHVRHHLVHFPDPVVRPGAMNFGAGHSTTVPESDQERFYLTEELAELKLVPKINRVKLGEPLPLSWQLTNKTGSEVLLPRDISLEAQHAHITVVNPQGVARYMPSFVIRTDAASLQDLPPGKQLSGDTNLFWSSNGFAFEIPGKHRVELRVVWSDRGVPYGVQTTVEVWVDYPTSDADNEVASLLMHGDVGMFVALGGEASHLHGAVSRIETAVSKHRQHPASSYVASLAGHKYSPGEKKGQ